MRVLAAIDSFKGSLSSMAAGRAVADGVRRAVPDALCTVRPLADGGEGTVDALVEGLGGSFVTIRATGPAGRPVDARYGLLPDGTAVMEMAAAAGLPLMGSRPDPLNATTFGVGEMMLDAANRGARSILMGIGGSATNDAGAGMLQALGFRLLDSRGEDLPWGGAALAGVAGVIPGEGWLSRGISIRVACDVENPLCGERGASAVFGPQKGAMPRDVALLDAALARFAAVAHAEEAASSPGAGAAGGLGFALKAFLGAELASGVELVAAATDLDSFVREADIVVTGEGRLDAQTAMGKAPAGVAAAAKRHGKVAIAFCGCVGNGADAVHGCGIDAYFPALRRVTTLEEAMSPAVAAENLASAAEQAFRLVRASAI